MTSQGPAREERWQLDAEGARLYCIDDLSDCLNLRDLAMDRKAVTDYLNALEAERDAYRQALERAQNRLQAAWRTADRTNILRDALADIEKVLVFLSPDRKTK